jgi:thiosulfate/3-mercaptopyruvate sulfurtransferase
MVDPSTTSNAELVLDARSRGRQAFHTANGRIELIFRRFLGTDPEPRPGLSSGHIPYSFSLPFTDFLKTNTALDGTKYTTFLSKEDLHKAVKGSVGVEQAGLIFDGIAPVVTSCGSGMTAGVLWLGLKLLGVEHISLYDEVRYDDLLPPCVLMTSIVLDWLCHTSLEHD